MNLIFLALGAIAPLAAAVDVIPIGNGVAIKACLCQCAGCGLS